MDELGQPPGKVAEPFSRVVEVGRIDVGSVLFELEKTQDELGSTPRRDARRGQLGRERLRVAPDFPGKWLENQLVDAAPEPAKYVVFVRAWLVAAEYAPVRAMA